MSWRELTCFRCNCHLGWMTDSGPCGLPFCDSCKNEDDEEEAEKARLSDALARMDELVGDVDVDVDAPIEEE